MYFVVLIIKVTTCSAELICVLICDSHDCLFCSDECEGTSDAKSEKATKAKERKQ